MSEVALRGERSAAPRDFVDRIYSSPFERTKFSENREEQSAFVAARHLPRPEEVTTHPHSFTEDDCEVAALLGNLRVALREFCLFDTENAQNSSFASQHLTLYLVLSGSAEVIVNGNLHQFDAGTVILVPRDFVLSMQAIRHRKSGLTVSRAELTANLGPGFSFFDMLKQPLVNRDDSKCVYP